MARGDEKLKPKKKKTVFWNKYFQWQDQWTNAKLKQELTWCKVEISFTKNVWKKRALSFFLPCFPVNICDISCTVYNCGYFLQIFTVFLALLKYYHTYLRYLLHGSYFFTIFAQFLLLHKYYREYFTTMVLVHCVFIHDYTANSRRK